MIWSNSLQRIGLSPPPGDFRLECVEHSVEADEEQQSRAGVHDENTTQEANRRDERPRPAQDHSQGDDTDRDHRRAVQQSDERENDEQFAHTNRTSPRDSREP